MDKNRLERLIAKDMSVREIANKVGKSYTTVRYWMKKHGLKTTYGENTKCRVSDAVFRKLVRQNIGVAGVLRGIDLDPRGRNYDVVYEKVARLGLDTTHWKGQSHGLSSGARARPLRELLVKDGTKSRSSLKRRILREGLLGKVCAICGMRPVWRGKPLVFRLDHINGKSRDHRQKNLRLVCPNCDSQLPTFTGRNKRIRS